MTLSFCFSQERWNDIPAPILYRVIVLSCRNILASRPIALDINARQAERPAREGGKAKVSKEGKSRRRPYARRVRRRSITPTGCACVSGTERSRYIIITRESASDTRGVNGEREKEREPLDAIRPRGLARAAAKPTLASSDNTRPALVTQVSPDDLAGLPPPRGSDSRFSPSFSRVRPRRYS